MQNLFNHIDNQPIIGWVIMLTLCLILSVIALHKTFNKGKDSK
jgi:hypothetical protein